MLSKIFSALTSLNCEKFEWDGTEVTLYKKGEPFVIREFTPGSWARKLFKELELHCVGNDYPAFVIELRS